MKTVLNDFRFWLGLAAFLAGFGVATWIWITRPFDLD